MAANPDDYARLLAVAIPVRSALDALERDDGRMGQGYHTERLVKQARRLRDVLNALEVSSPSGSAPLG